MVKIAQFSGSRGAVAPSDHGETHLHAAERADARDGQKAHYRPHLLEDESGFVTDLKRFSILV